MDRQNEPSVSNASDAGTCFVIMPFASHFDRYYRNLFVPAITELNLKPVRGDGIFGSAIMADIWSALRKSTIAIADLTGRNPNVFYELGLAHALGKPVILVASDAGDVPIDLGGLRVILYNKDNEDWGVRLQSDIGRAIAEVLRDPIRGAPATFFDPEAYACLTGDPIQVEIRRLGEEIKALRFGMRQSAIIDSKWQKPPDAADAVVNSVFPRTRAAGLSWGQAQHAVDLVLAGRESEALSYIESVGTPRAEAVKVLRFIVDCCKT